MLINCSLHDAAHCLRGGMYQYTNSLTCWLQPNCNRPQNCLRRYVCVPLVNCKLYSSLQQHTFLIATASFDGTGLSAVRSSFARYTNAYPPSPICYQRSSSHQLALTTWPVQRTSWGRPFTCFTTLYDRWFITRSSTGSKLVGTNSAGQNAEQRPNRSHSCSIHPSSMLVL